MEIGITKTDLVSLVKRQLGSLFMFDEAAEGSLLSGAVDLALEKCGHCFSHTPNKYYRRNGVVYFNPFHSGQYCIFLYFLSRAVFLAAGQPNTLADRIYFLNKCLNSLDLYYEVELPDIFFLDHPVGTVLGRARYGDGFSFSQSCTVGNNKGIYPVLGENVKLMSGAKILGKCLIGSKVVIAANALVMDCDIPDCSVVFGSSPHLTIKKRELAFFRNELQAAG